MTPRLTEEEKKAWRRKPATTAQLDEVERIRIAARLDPADLDRFIAHLWKEGTTLADLNRGAVSSLIQRIEGWNELTPEVLRLRGQTELPI